MTLTPHQQETLDLHIFPPVIKPLPKLSTSRQTPLTPPREISASKLFIQGVLVVGCWLLRNHRSRWSVVV